MYYKVLKNNEVVDTLKDIHYIKYQSKHNLLLLCNIQEAEAILSSNGMRGWHIIGLYNFQPDNYEYEIIEITKSEYDELNKDKVR